jgi:hypothetical protein
MGVSFGYFAVDFVTCVKYTVSDCMAAKAPPQQQIQLFHIVIVNSTSPDTVMCVVWLQMGGMEMVLHHLGSLLAVTTALVTGNGHMHTIWMLVTEFTTPLINNRWWLEKIVSAMQAVLQVGQ